ncbi:MAG: CoA transferase [Gammaproteobacteria bacterium]|nr:CoA transferase [Gammaproteobacteria bacterium]
MSNSSQGPLAGVRAIELGQIAAGPFTGSLLADLGADVIKIERPDGGDGMRSWPPLSTADGDDTAYSENFASLNRNKRSVALDLKVRDDVDRLLRLTGVADVLVENYRPGVLARLGADYDAVSARNPKIVYCSISGYGQTGPYANKGAFDVSVQGMSGLMSVTGEPRGGPVKCGVPVGDFCAGLYAAYTITASLMRAAETGRGAYIDCSMLGSLIGVAALQTSEYFGTGAAPRPLGSAHPRNAPYQAFRASDEHFIIAAGNDRLFAQVCAAVGLSDLADDPRFTSQLLRAEHQSELVAILGPRFAERTAAEWLGEMDARGVPCAPINDYPRVLDDPQVAHLGLVHPLTLPNGVETRTTGFPVAMSGYAFEIHRPPPALGAHTAEVLEEWLGETPAAKEPAAQASTLRTTGRSRP